MFDLREGGRRPGRIPHPPPLHVADARQCGMTRAQSDLTDPDFCIQEVAWLKVKLYPNFLRQNHSACFVDRKANAHGIKIPIWYELCQL